MSFFLISTMANLKNTILVFLVLSVILIAGCSTSESENNEQNYNDFVPDNTEVDIPDVDNPFESVKGNVVAVVNDEEIMSEDVAQIQQTFLMQGQQISEEDALEQVIVQKVLEQEVQQENIVVTTEDAENLIEQQLMMQGATLDEYKEQLQTQGISYEDDLESVKNQIAIQNYLDVQLEGQSFVVSEEEAQEFYEMYKLESPEEVPPYEELEPQIVMTLEQQKQQEAINVFIQELLTTAVIEYK